jgi:hypothetical protein
MRPQLVTLAIILASTPAAASLDADYAVSASLSVKAALEDQVMASPDEFCGEAGEMHFILVDPTGIHGAAGTADVLSSC